MKAIDDIAKEFGFKLCEFTFDGLDGEACDCCDNSYLSGEAMYFRSTCYETDEGEYFCSACVMKEPDRMAAEAELWGDYAESVNFGKEEPQIQLCNSKGDNN